MKHTGLKLFIFLRFLKEYDALDVPMWGLTVQNEPTAGLIPFYPWQCMAMEPHTTRDFVKMDLGPALRDNGYGHLKLMTHDDNLPAILEDTETVRYQTDLLILNPIYFHLDVVTFLIRLLPMKVGSKSMYSQISDAIWCKLFSA